MGGYDAGSIEATAELNSKPFYDELRLVHADGKKLADSTFTPKIGADAKDADATILDLNTKLQQVRDSKTSAKVTADTADIDGKLVSVNEKLAQLRDVTVKAKIALDGDEKAKRSLSDIDLALRRVGLINSRPKVSLSGVEGAEISLDRLEERLRRVGTLSPSVSAGSSGGGGGGISHALGSIWAPKGKTLAIAAAIPLAGPLAGLGLGAGASLLTPFTAAGVGLASFGLAAKSTLTKVSADTKTLTADQQAYNAATSDKTRAAAQAKELKFWDSLPKSEQSAVTNLHKLSGEWSNFQKSLQPEIYPLISGGVKLASVALSDLNPVAKATGTALDGIEKSAQKAFGDPFWHSFFVQFLPGQATKALDSFSTAGGNLLTGFGHLVEDFAPLGQDLEHGLDRLTQKFETWTEGSGPNKFVAWVQKNGPAIATDLGKLAEGIGHTIVALTPLGGGELHIIGDLAGELDKMSPTHIRELGEALLVLGGGLKVLKFGGQVSSSLGAITALFGRGGGQSKASSVIEGLFANTFGGGSGGSGSSGGSGGIVGNAESQAKSDAESKAEDAATKAAETAGAAAAGAAATRLPFLTSLKNIVANPKTLLADGSAATAATLALIPLATEIAGLGIPKDIPGAFGAVNGKEYTKPQYFSKFPALANLQDPALFPLGVKAQHSSESTQEADLGPNGAGNIPRLVQSIVGTGNKGEIAELVKLGATIPSIASALQKYAFYANTATRATLLLQNSAKDVAVAETNMSDVVSKVGSNALKGNSTAAQANRDALAGAVETVKSYRDNLIAAGTPLGQVRSKTDAYATSLQTQAKALYGNTTELHNVLKGMDALPGQVSSKLTIRGIADALTSLASLDAYLKEIHNKSIDVTVRRNILDTGPGHTATVPLPGDISNPPAPTHQRGHTGRFLPYSDTHLQVVLGHGSSISPRGLPPWVTSIGSTSPNAPTSSSSSSSHAAASAAASAARSAAAHRLASSNAGASIINFAATTFLSEIQGTEAQIRTGIISLIDRLNSAVRNKYLTSDKTLVQALHSAYRPLRDLATQEAATGTALNAAQSRLSTLQGDASSLRSGTVSAYQGLGDVSQLSNVSSVAGILSVVGKQDSVAKAFTRNLGILRKKGLSKKEYDELEQAGPAAAGQVVALLATATSAQIRSLNKDTDLLTSLGISTGKASSSYVYGSQIASSKHEVAMLRRQDHELISAQRAATKALVALTKAGLQDKGTHARLERLEKQLALSNRLLAKLTNAPGGAALDKRTHVPGVH